VDVFIGIMLSIPQLNLVPRVLSFCHLGETLAAAGHVPPRFWEVNLIVTVKGVGKERVCSVLKLQLWVMKFTVNLQQGIVKRTLKLIFIS
jgi:hypothetical protein